MATRLSSPRLLAKQLSSINSFTFFSSWRIFSSGLQSQCFTVVDKVFNHIFCNKSSYQFFHCFDGMSQTLKYSLMIGRLNNTSLRLTYLRVLAQGEVQAQPDLEDQTQVALNNNKTTIKQRKSFISTKIKSETKYQNEAKKQYKNKKLLFPAAV